MDLKNLSGGQKLMWESIPKFGISQNILSGSSGTAARAWQDRSEVGIKSSGGYPKFGYVCGINSEGAAN